LGHCHSWLVLLGRVYLWVEVAMMWVAVMWVELLALAVVELAVLLR
jgi:hypothetical protein